LRIVIFCYPCESPAWSPDSINEGIGGSEEAVIHVTRRLAGRGHDVVVVNRQTGPEERFGSVPWTSYERGPPKADIGIVWRRPGLLDLIAPDTAKRLYLWLHDWLPQTRVLARLDAFAKVMVLSRFHRSRIAAVPDDKVYLTANGIDPADMAARVARDPNLMVYGSCYTRGLQTLLETWPQIRRSAPGARLNVFYGWDIVRRNRPRHFARIHPHFERLMSQDGVTHLGKVGHAEVARQYASAGIWAYPCAFPEASCISAMKAQAAGAVPAVIPTGALDETVRHGFKTMRSHTDYEPLPLPHRVIDEWLDGLTALLCSPERQDRIRAEMMLDSPGRFDWNRVVSAWEAEFAGA
jgi:glycosyltransferase involved in cell wall biosynthesis